MSGGQKQIINLFRAIFTKKDIILLDEPTASLDPINRKKIYDMVKVLKNLKKTVIIATHDNDLIKLGDRIVTLEKGRLI